MGGGDTQEEDLSDALSDLKRLAEVTAGSQVQVSRVKAKLLKILFNNSDRNLTKVRQMMKPISLLTELPPSAAYISDKVDQ